MVGLFSDVMTAGVAWRADEEHGGQDPGDRVGLHESLGYADTSKVCQPPQSLLCASMCNEENSELAQEPY